MSTRVKKRTSKLLSFALAFALVLAGTGTFAGLSGILAPAMKARAEGTELNHAVTAGTIYRINNQKYVATATADSGNVMFIEKEPIARTYTFDDLDEVFVQGAGGALDVTPASHVVSNLDTAGLIPALVMSDWSYYDSTSGTVTRQCFFGVPSKTDVENATGFSCNSAAWTSTNDGANNAYYVYGSSITSDVASNSKRALIAFRLNLSAEGVYVYTKNGFDYITHAIPVDEEHFPDENFRNWILSRSYGSDGALTDSEIAGVTEIDVNSKEIADLTGIEHFTALEILDCHNNQLTSLDVSHNTALTNLLCYDNQLTSLDVSHNTALTNIQCHNNQLTSLDVSGCTVLEYLHCFNNNLTSLDVSHNTALTELYCHTNSLTSLDLSNNTYLTMYGFYNNQFAELKARFGPSGSLATISNGGFGTIEVKSCSFYNKKISLDDPTAGGYTFTGWTITGDATQTEGDGVTTFTIGSGDATITATWEETGIAINETTFPDANFRNRVLSQSYGADGKLTPSEIEGVTEIAVDSDMNADESEKISDLTGIEYFTALVSLSCVNNKITSLDVSRNTALTYLYCVNNKIAALDLSHNTSLTTLDCYGNPLTSINKAPSGYNGIGRVTVLNGGHGTFTPTFSRGFNYSYREVNLEDAVSDDTDYTFAGWEVTSGTATKNGKNFKITSEDVVITAQWEEVSIPINGTTFPDENFRNYILSQDYGSDGVLTQSEIAGVTAIDVSDKEIADLTGIEYFTALKILKCYSNQLTNLDLSNNTALTELYCYNNQLTSLDVSHNTALKTLKCYGNRLTSLDVSNNTALTWLECNNNQLTSLDVSNNTALTKLSCSNNQLTSLDLSGCTALTGISFYSNQLTELKAKFGSSGSLATFSNGGFGTIEQHEPYYFYLDNKKISLNDPTADGYTFTGWEITGDATQTAGDGKTDFVFGTGDATITATWKQNAPAITIDEEHFPDANFRNYILSESYGADGKLTPSEIAGVTVIDVSNQEIADLTGIEYFTALTMLNCPNNQLTSLDVSKNTALTDLDCENNSLTSLDVSGCTALTTLGCYSNRLTNLDVSGCTALTTLDCYSNRLTSLDVSHNTALTGLVCYGNQLTSLDVSHNTALTTLDCHSNQFTALKVKFGSSGSLATISNGGFGTIAMDYSSFTYKKISLDDPTADGCTFTGWEITGDVTKEERTTGNRKYTYFTFGTGDATITATWKQLFTVKYVNGLGTTLLEETVAEGSATPTYTGAPTREGYTFTGWTPTVASTVTADATYTATWEQNATPMHTVTIKSQFLDTDSHLLEETQRTVDYEEGETVTIEAPTVDGYFIVGQTSVTLTVDNDSTVVFVYQQNPATDPTDPTDPEEKPYSVTVALPFKMRWQGISGENITKTLGNVKIEYTSKQYGRFAGVALLVVDTSRLPDGKQIKVSIPNRNVTINVGGVDLTASVVAFEDAILDNSGSCQLRIDLVTDRDDLLYDDFFGKPISGGINLSVEELT